MSHTVTIEVAFSDPDALSAACQRLGIEPPRQITAEKPVSFYAGNGYSDGTAVQLKGWKYPVVIQDGKARIDNFGGIWGAQARLDELKQAYAIEKTLAACKAKGWRATETLREDGSMELIVRKGY